MVKRNIVDPEVREWMLTNHVRFLHKVAILYQGKVLVVKKDEKQYSRPNAWDLPGGNSTWPESESFVDNPHFIDIKREIREETGIVIDPSQLTSVYHATGYQPEKERYVILLGYVTKLEGKQRPEVTLTEHSEYQWIEPDEAVNLDFGEGGDYLLDVIEFGAGGR